MPNFVIHTPESAPGGSRGILEQTQKGLGFVPNLYGVMASSPAALKAYTSLSEVLQGSDFTPVERNLVWLAVSRANACAYCVAAHSAISAMGKVPEEIIKALRDGLPLGDPKLQALRLFAEQVVEHRGWVPPAGVHAFLEAGYSHRQLIEVVAFVAHKTLSNYLNHIAETPLDQAFQPLAWSPESGVQA